MGEVALLSLIAAFNPSLLAATTVMLLLPRPERLMFGYWIGAILMGIVSGLVIVFALSGTSAGQTTNKTVSPAVDLALAALALIGVLVLAAGRTKPSKARRTKRKNGNKTPKWQQKMREGTARTTFVIGIALSLPGVSYLAALDRLHKLHYSTVVTVLVVIGFNLVQLVLLEIPIVAFEFAPRRTPIAIEHAKAWFRGHGRELATGGLAVIGGWLAVRGIVNLHS
jgi:Sap, sulfolipid-1-addressing protein